MSDKGKDSSLRWLASAFLAGGAANFLFIVGYMELLLSLKWPRLKTVACWLGWGGFFSAIAARLLAEYASGESSAGLYVFYPAHGMWAGSMLMFALGCSGINSAHRKSP
jgi:hypothetical protein